ncbi:MAG: hypothetical protein ABR511_05605 [Acidimicrobiales bacterium]
MQERRVWAVKVLIEATEDQAEAAEEAITRAPCPDENHPGHCPLPWTLVKCALGDLDEVERADWQQTFDEQRRLAPEAGESGVDS